jgi:hypothetical protein
MQNIVWVCSPLACGVCAFAAALANSESVQAALIGKLGELFGLP